MKIYGAGLAGLLAANMLKNYNPTIIEKQKELPNNHKALLRHRDNLIGDALGMEFKPVTVRKAINYKGEIFDKCSIAMGNEYSKKVTGEYSNRSIWNLKTEKRYIAPPNLIEMLSVSCNFKFNVDIEERDILNESSPIISTIPLPIILSILDINNCVNFQYRKIFVVNALIEDCDVYQTIYYPHNSLPMYRMSITGNKVICEFTFEPDFKKMSRHGVNGVEEFIKHFLQHDFGITAKELIDIKASNSNYGKIIDIQEHQRKGLIKMLTDRYGIYSVGRYATWRNILLDDVFHDIKIVHKMINGHGYYTGK
jgi:hypothetical protein